ncbi:MAG: hypothetical protein JWO33_304 [Caulobacteraceae bacterium]|nr:hypothetical protein [Caulobacteraceae bacterium]
MMRPMTAILYPVAANAEAALSRPLAHAARQSEARRAAGEAVVFATDPMGPAFATREAALDAYGKWVGDERTGAAPEVQDRYCRLQEQTDGARAPAPVEPVFADGHRWPAKPAKSIRTVWRLQVSYWRIATATRPLEAPQARQARRGRQSLDAEALKTISRQPLRPVKPQQPLDIGLFETHPPEAPHIVMPDE